MPPICLAGKSARCATVQVALAVVLCHMATRSQYGLYATDCYTNDLRGDLRGGRQEARELDSSNDPGRIAERAGLAVATDTAIGHPILVVESMLVAFRGNNFEAPL